MVFEAMHQNLRQALRQHGHKRGIQLDAVKIYARQLFVALRYMERLNIMHADLKPDNIVVNDKYNLLKVCDFGSAANGDDNEITPYLVSRFYRAPEIMLGLHYGCPVDMWATPRLLSPGLINPDVFDVLALTLTLTLALALILSLALPLPLISTLTHTLSLSRWAAGCTLYELYTGKG